MSDLPERPTAGHTRYKAVTRKPNANPFAAHGLAVCTQTVDVPKDVPREQVERWARESAHERRLHFLRLEVIA